MPVILVERLPLPSLKAYTTISVLLLAGSVYYAIQVTQGEPGWGKNGQSSGSGPVQVQPQEMSTIGRILGSANIPQIPDNNNTTSGNRSNSSFAHQFADLVTFMIQEPHCIWTVINMAYCVLILVGKCVQRCVFGELRVSEQQHIKDKFWNFVFYKFIFVFGVVNVQYMDEVMLWCSWFSLLGFLQLLAQLCKDRFEYLSFSPTTAGWSHARLLALLTCILFSSICMLTACAVVGYLGAGLNTFAFMAAECVLLAIRVEHCIVRYLLHLYDLKRGAGPQTDSINQDGEPTLSVAALAWEKRGPIAYYTELIFELASLVVDFGHHLHMLLWSNIFLSMASLVICMQLRYLFHEIQRRIKKHTNYLWVLNHMEKNYPMASEKELAENCDNCAICWEKMENARKLPCSHLFHASCLQSWLEQDTSCPTCRLGLNLSPPPDGSAAGSAPTVGAAGGDVGPMGSPTGPVATFTRGRGGQPNHFFHFDGSRYVSWLPSFSVEVTHHAGGEVGAGNVGAGAVQQTSQLDAMARQVQQLFPQVSIQVILEDLRVTRSIELTVENVLEGRLISRVTPPPPDPPTVISPPPAVTQSAARWSVPSNPPIEEESSATLGSRFSKSPTERERILQRRKELMLHQARKKFLEKHQTS